jgi:UDP-N-acetylmuramoylalanine--D-glutamate ligase
VQAIPGPVILIAGGVDKGAAYTPWLEIFAGKVHCVCAIGNAAEKIERDISSTLPVHRFMGLEQAVLYAASKAVQGDTILLSPGCSSFDMFEDYAHRGSEFMRIVNSL